jgi:membrane dipeptidase
MNRREFLAKLMRYGISAGALSALPVEQLFAQEFDPRFTIPIVDAHAHYPGDLSTDAEGYTFPAIHEAKLCATVFAVLGDRSKDIEDGPYIKAIEGIESVSLMESRRQIKIVRQPIDIPLQPTADGPIPVILAIEGGDAIGKNLKRLDEFYKKGVRLITLVHGTTSQNGDNLIGNDMRQHSSSDETDEGLTRFGRQVVARMNKLGMVVDVAHASAQTLFDVAACTRAPIVDSHTSMLPPSVTERIAGRQRLYSEAEAIVETGGVVCTYPLRDPLPEPYSRLTLTDWVEEVQLFKSEFGIRHIGLGPDSGGGVPRMPEWVNIGSVQDLEGKMRFAGLGTLEISAFMSLNFLRVFTRCHLAGQALSFFNA